MQKQGSLFLYTLNIYDKIKISRLELITNKRVTSGTAL